MFDENTVNAVSEEVVEPQETEVVETKTEGLENESENNSEVAEPKAKQDVEENAKYAAARKDAERKMLESEQRAAKLERDNSIARKYGAEYGVYSDEDIKRQYGERGINNLEELEAAIQTEKYKEAGIDPNIINEIVSNHPAIKEATTYTENIKQQQQQENIKKSFDDLHKEFPGVFDHIKAVEDVVKDSKFAEIQQYINKGYELSDAYYKAYKNDVISKTKQSAQQSTIANIQDKAKRGIVSTNDGGEDNTPIDLSEEGKRMASVFGTNPGNIAKYVKSQLKK